MAAFAASTAKFNPLPGRCKLAWILFGDPIWLSYLDLRRFGTFLPFCRASESPMAMACLRLVTFFLLLPLRSVPRLRLRIARCTSLEELREYRRAIAAPFD
jgi:hypothetical protein